MASIKNIVFVLLIAMAAASIHQSQSATVDPEEAALRIANWSSCDITTDPVLSCADCNTRRICKPIGALNLACLNPFRPHCVDGVCSPIPSAECDGKGSQ